MVISLRNIFCLVALIFTSCNKLLDVKPRNVAVEGELFRTTGEIQLLLNSAYDALRNDKFMGGSVWIATELLADNMESGQLNDHFLAIYNRRSTIFNDVSRQIWNHAYIVIYRCNLVLNALEKAPGIRPEDLAAMRGQALFLRSYCHYLILNLFAQPWGFTSNNEHPGIPLRLETGFDPIPRSSVKESYNQIINDLSLAIQELPAQVTGGTANVWTAKALLAKIYFQRNEFQFALKLSRDVVENGPYTFQNSLLSRFSPIGNKENILELVNENPRSTIVPSGKILWDYYHSSGTKPKIYIHSVLGQILEKDPEDLRKKLWLIKDSVLQNTSYYCAKFNSSPVFRVPLIHLSELKLIYAECAVEMGDVLRSSIQINDIRKRAGLVELKSMSNEECIQEARYQRRLEMVGEGNRLHEIRRIILRDGTPLFIRNAPWNCNGLVLAIPDDEMSANPLIKQNPEGGCN